MRLASRAVLAVALLVGVYVLAAGVAVGLLWLAWSSFHDGRTGLLVVTVLLLVAVAAAALGVLRGSRDGSAEPVGLELDPTRCPALWAEVRALAESAGARTPDRVRLTPEVSIAVRERTRLLGLVGGTRTLDLGAPLLFGLTRQQARAVLAHELGHHGTRPLALGALVHRGREALDRAADRHGRASMVGGLCALLARVYAATTSPVQRAQELAADDAGVLVAGRDAAASALLELPVVEAAWQYYLDEFVLPAHGRGLRPDAFFEGFAEIVEAPRLQGALASFRELPPEEGAAAAHHDHHGALRTRVERIRGLPQDGRRDDGTPALTLLDDVEGVLHALQEVMYDGLGLAATPWHGLLAGQDAPVVRTQARALYAAALDVEGHQVSLGALVRGVRSGKLTDWVRTLAPDARGQDLAVTTTALLNAAVIEALISTRDLTVTRSWDTEARLVNPAGRTVDTDAVVAGALSSHDPTELEGWLADHGVDPSYVPDHAGTAASLRPAGSPYSLLAVAAPVSGGGTRSIAALEGGLLLLRVTWRDRLTVLTTVGSPGTAMVRRLVATAYAEPAADPSNTWLPWNRIELVEMQRRPGRGPRLRVHAGDRVRVVRFERATKFHGDLVVAMSQHLGDRLRG